MCGECRVMCDQEERRYWILHVPFRGFPLRSSLPPPHTLFPHTLPPHTLLSHPPLTFSPSHPPLTFSPSPSPHTFTAGGKDNESAEDYFKHIMAETDTLILWPSRLKIGAKSKKGSEY